MQYGSHSYHDSNPLGRKSNSNRPYDSDSDDSQSSNTDDDGWKGYLTRWRYRYRTTTAIKTQQHTLVRTKTDVKTDTLTLRHGLVRTKTDVKTTTTTKKEYIVETETRFHTTTATVTSCDRWHRHCRPHVVTLTETKVFPTTIYCRHDCPPRHKTITCPAKVTKTVVDFEVVTIESICTKVETETQYHQVPVPCHPHPCPPKPETTTVTKFLLKTIPYPCVITKEGTVTKKAPQVCTYIETRFKFHEQPQLQCHRRPCGPKTVTETLIETVTRACIKTKHVLVPTTIPIIKPIIKPIPVKCTVTELETVRETVTCRAKPCPPKTLTKVITHTKVQPCVVKQTDIVTKKVPIPIPQPFPIECTYTTTETQIRKVPVTCTKYPCPKTKTSTMTNYVTRTVVTPSIQRETEVVTKVKPVPVIIKEKEFITTTTHVPVIKTVPVMCTVTEIKTKIRGVPGKCTRHPCKVESVTEYIPVEVLRTCTETETVTRRKPFPVKEWCTVTETEVITHTRSKFCIISCPPKTSTEILTLTKMKLCVVTETLPVPYPVPTPYPYTKEVPVPYPVPVPVEKKVPVPCKEIQCPPRPPCRQKPCPAPQVGLCYEDKTCYPSPQPKPGKQRANKRWDDDQCPPPPSVFKTEVRECDVHGVILHFDRNGLLRDQLNRIGYIADNFQFQFDLPVQSGGYGEKEFGKYKDPKTGDIFLTWRGSPDFYKCRSGNFDNLYSQSIGAQCKVTRIMIFRCVVSMSYFTN